MDFLDPKKQRQHKLRLLIGYCLMTIVVVLATSILLYQAYGYGLKNGQIIQNGFVFIDSQPNPANIYINGKLTSSTTNARLQLPAGQYTVKLERNGYRPWIRAVGVEGGSVEYFDYPLLFPKKLITTPVQQYASQPGLLTQSPNQQWLLIQKPGSTTDFYEYDLNNQPQLTATLKTLSIPTSDLATQTSPISWSVVSWSTDNNYVLLHGTYTGGSEYLEFDRNNPANSKNLTATLSLNPTTSLSLLNNAYNQYLEYDSANQTLFTASLTTPQPKMIVNGVLAFKSYDTNTFLYATDKNAPAGKVEINLDQGGTIYHLMEEPANTQYLLNLTQYNNNTYVVVGATSDNKVYVYENPLNELQATPVQPLVPVSILKVSQPNYESFSTNAEYIVAENGDSFAVFDAQTQKTYAYKLSIPIDTPHAAWMDGNRLILVSNGRVVVFDYDDANQQMLQPALSGATVFFDQNYQWMYTLAPTNTLKNSSNSTQPFSLTSTSLLIPSDQ